MELEDKRHTNKSHILQNSQIDVEKELNEFNILLYSMLNISTFECELFTRKTEIDVKNFIILVKKIMLNAIVELEKNRLSGKFNLGNNSEIIKEAQKLLCNKIWKVFQQQLRPIL